MTQQSPQYHSEGGSFITGFTVGLFAGAAGYYLFATSEGAKLRKKLAAEWEATKEKLAQDGLIENPDISLREFIMEMKDKALHFTSPEQTEHVLLAEDGTPEQKTPRTRSKKDTSKRFKGV